MMAGRAEELGETAGAYDEAKYETHAGEYFDGPMDGALESKYGDLFAGYDEDGEALGSPAEETVASGGTQKTLATLATARFRAMSDKELVKMVRELDGATGERAATRKAADEAALVADQELTRAVQQDRLAGEAARVYRELEAAANAHPLGRSSLSKAELAALADAKRAALGADAAASRQRATAARERDAERVAEHVAQRTERSCAALAEKALKAKAAKAEKLEAAALKARETVDLEIAGAERRVRAHEGRLDAARTRRAEKEALDDRRARAAVEGRTKAKRRVARSGAVTREVRAHCDGPADGRARDPANPPRARARRPAEATSNEAATNTRTPRRASMMQGAPSGTRCSIWMRAPDRRWSSLIVSPPLPMTRPTRALGHSKVVILPGLPLPTAGELPMRDRTSWTPSATHCALPSTVTTRGVPSGKFWSIWMRAPDRRCRSLIVSPCLPMRRPTSAWGQCTVSSCSGPRFASCMPRGPPGPQFWR